MLQTPKRSVQESSVAAIAATAIAAELAFLPFLPRTADMLCQLLNVTDEKMLMLRGRSLECMGHIGFAVGAEAFKVMFTCWGTCLSSGVFSNVQR